MKMSELPNMQEHALDEYHNDTKGPKVFSSEQKTHRSQPAFPKNQIKDAYREDKDKKKSVMKQLTSKPVTEQKRKALTKSAEMEI